MTGGIHWGILKFYWKTPKCQSQYMFFSSSTSLEGENRQWCNSSLHMGFFFFPSNSVGSLPFVLRAVPFAYPCFLGWVTAIFVTELVQVKTCELWTYFSLSVDLFSKWKTDFQDSVSFFYCGLVVPLGFLFC